MPSLARVLPAALAAALLVAAPAAHAATIPANQRPHTRLATYDRNGVTVPRLEATVRPAARGLRLTVDARIHNDLHLVKSVVLRVGSCTSGHLAHPNCPDTLTLDVAVAPGTTKTVHRTVVVPAPPVRVDRVAITITKHGKLPPSRVGGLYGELLLDGHAWRGASAGRAFGLSMRPNNGTAIQRILVDAAAQTTTSFRAAVAWTAGSGQAVTLSTGLAGEVLHPDTTVPAAGRASFFDRPDINVKRRISAFTALVRAPGVDAPLASVRLPWPI